MLKVTVDTNVWVSSLIATGTAYTVKGLFEQGHFQLYISVEILEELANVVARPKFAKRIDRQNAKDLFKLIESVGIFVQLPKSIKPVSRDPDDDIYLACVKVAYCHYLITGDSDLLTLKKHEQTRIITPAEFLKVLQDG